MSERSSLVARVEELVPVGQAGPAVSEDVPVVYADAEPEVL